MKILQCRIRELRKQHNLTQGELASKLRERYGLKTDRVMVSKWETGFQTPEIYTILCMAELFGVSIDYLNGKEIPNLPKSLLAPNITEDYVTFPVIGEIAAGYDNIAIEDWSGETVDIPTKFLKGRNKNDFFVLTVTGDSMYPLYHEGDKVLILKQNTLARSGDIGAFMDDDGCATLKKIEYIHGEDWLKLVPLNHNYGPKIIEGEKLAHCRVIGVPRLLIREIK